MSKHILILAAALLGAIACQRSDYDEPVPVQPVTPVTPVYHEREVVQTPGPVVHDTQVIEHDVPVPMPGSEAGTQPMDQQVQTPPAQQMEPTAPAPAPVPQQQPSRFREETRSDEFHQDLTTPGADNEESPARGHTTRRRTSTVREGQAPSTPSTPTPSPSTGY